VRCHYGWSPIEKSVKDYEETRQTFSWALLDNALKGSGEGLNIADIAIARHAKSDCANHVAMRFLAKDWSIKEFTYQDLQAQTNRFANVLKTLGVMKGDRVFVLAGRIPSLYIAALGTLKNGSVFCPLFSAFGPEPVLQRMDRGDAKVLVTTQLLYKQKVATLRSRLPNLKHILLADVEEDLVIQKIWHCSTSPVEPPERQRARFTFTKLFTLIT
jgi:acetyl-CoA synthetase